MNKINNNDIKREKVYLEQQSRCDQLQADEIENMNQSSKSQFKQSMKAEQYQREFIRSRKIPPILYFIQRFKQHQINFLSDSQIPIQIQIEHTISSYNNRIMHYKVRISTFLVKIKIFNIIEEDKYLLELNNKINQGMFGTVYAVTNPFKKQQQVAVKVILFNYQPYKIISDAIKEYALMKLLSALTVGPQIIKLFGYDLVVTSRGLMFSMERAIPLSTWIQGNSSTQKIQKQIQKLQVDLLLLHSLNICHNDIKPPNIMYSPTLGKLIFIDFGLSEVRPQSLGLMGLCHAKGSLCYCSQEMKQVFLTTGQGYVDMYYNDYICMKKSKQLILTSYPINSNCLQTQNKSPQMDEYSLNIDSYDLIMENAKQTNCFQDIVIIYFAHLIEQADLFNFTNFINQQIWILPIIEFNIRKVCLFFLQIEISISLWQIFNKFSSIFINDNASLSVQIKNLIQQRIKPCFKQFLSGIFCTISEPSQITQNNLQFQHKIRKRYHKIYNILTNNGISQLQFNQKEKQQQEQFQLNLNEEDENILERCFMKLRNLSYYQQKQLIQSLMTVLNRRKWYAMSQRDVSILQQCLMLANIKVVSYNNTQQPRQIYRRYLHLFNKYIKFMHRSFDLGFIFQIAIKYNYQDIPTMIQLAKQLSNESNNSSYSNNDNSQYSERNSKTFSDNKSYSGSQYNYIEILQSYIILSEQMFMTFQKNLSYNESITLLKDHIEIFHTKVNHCIRLKEIFKKVENDLFHLVNIFTKRYILFIYETAMHGYTLACQQCDYHSCFTLHKQLTMLKTQTHQGKDGLLAPKRLKQINFLEHFGDFINLMIFADLVPVTLIQRFMIVEQFQLFIQRIEWVQKLMNMDQITVVNFNSKFMLFTLYIGKRQIMKAIKLGNKLLNQRLFTISQHSTFVVQSLFRKLNNSKKSREVIKKLSVVNDSNQTFTPGKKQLIIQNALIKLVDEVNIFQKQNLQHQSKSSDMSKIWQQCVNSESHEMKFTERLYVLRMIITKLIMSGNSITEYVNYYYLEMKKYSIHLHEKIIASKQLTLYQYYIINHQKQLFNHHQHQSILDGMHGEFIIIQLQYLIVLLINEQLKINDHQLIQSCWQHYQQQFYKRFHQTNNSEEVRQCHAQLLCKKIYLQCRIVIERSGGVVQGEHAQQQLKYQSLKIMNLKQQIEQAKVVFEQSVVSYLRCFNKQLLSHEFYIHVLLALSHRTMQLKEYSYQWARLQIRKYFIFLIRNQQIFFFFYQNELTKKFMSQVLQIAALQLVQSSDKRGKQNRSLNKGKFSERQQLRKNTVTGQQEQIDGQLITFIFKSFSEFIEDNWCLSYQQLFVDMILQQKKVLIQCINKHLLINNNIITNDYFQGKGVKAVESIGQQHLNLKILHNIQQSLLLQQKTNRNHAQKSKNCWVMVNLMKILFVEYHLKVPQTELITLSTHLVTLTHHYHKVIAQAYHVLDVQYTRQQLSLATSHDLSFKNESEDVIQRERKHWKAVKRLFRKYSQRNMIKDQAKYVMSLIRRIRQGFTGSGLCKISSDISAHISRKLFRYVENNLGQRIFI